MGALTSKPFAFKARSWELEQVSAIDFYDPLGTFIRLDVRGTDILRILPRVKEGLNDEWISDRIRFVFSALKRQRLVEPFYFTDKNLVSTSVVNDWFSEVNYLANFIKTNRSKIQSFRILFGPFVDFETVFALKTFVNSFFSTQALVDSVSEASPIADFRSFFTSQPTVLASADSVLIILTPFTVFSPVWSIRLRSIFKLGVPIFIWGSSDVIALSHFIGPNQEQPVQLGASISTFLNFIEGRHPLSHFFTKALKPTVVFSDVYFLDNWSITGLISLMNKRLLRAANVFLPRAISTFSLLELGFAITPFANNTVTSTPVDLQIAMGSEDFYFKYPLTPFSIYFGFQSDQLDLTQFNVVFPTPAPFEKECTHFNMFGQFLQSSFAVSPPSSTRVEWRILSVLTHFLLNQPRHQLDFSSVHFFETRIEYFSFLKNKVFGGFEKTPTFYNSVDIGSHVPFYFSPLFVKDFFISFSKKIFGVSNLSGFSLTSLDRLSPLLALAFKNNQFRGNFDLA